MTVITIGIIATKRRFDGIARDFVTHFPTKPGYTVKLIHVRSVEAMRGSCFDAFTIAEWPTWIDPQGLALYTAGTPVEISIGYALSPCASCGELRFGHEYRHPFRVAR